jgi:hypothetical protein
MCNLHNNTTNVLLFPLSNLYDTMHSAKSHITDTQFTCKDTGVIGYLDKFQ